MILLNEEEITIVKKILTNYCPDAKVWLFGSRTTGKAKQYADLDILIKMNQPIPLRVMFLIKDDFAESNLPFIVDVVDWHRITPEFRMLITPQLHEFIN